MEKKIQVVMLATDKSSALVLNLDNKLEFDIVLSTYGGVTQQHLYFLSDDEIKEGDWYMTSEYTIHKKGDVKTSMFVGINSNRKIIASTDKTLGLPELPKEWIEYFLSQYNQGNIISEVMVEHERYQTYELDANSREMLDFKYTPKVNPDNTIHIKMEETWDDIYSKYEKYRFYHPQVSFIEWLKENNYKVSR